MELADLRRALGDLAGSLKVSEQLNPTDVYAEIEKLLFDLGYRFTSVDVPDPGHKGQIEFKAVKGDQFVEVYVMTTGETATVEVKAGRRAGREVTSVSEIADAVRGLVGSGT